MVPMTDADRLVGLLATSERLRVVAALVLGEDSISGIAAAADLDERSTVRALGRLVDGGLVAHRDGSFVVLEVAFSLAARRARPVHDDDGERPDDLRARTLRRVFDGEQLIEIPTKRATRRVVLDELARRFEVGRHYSEQEVNASLALVHPDTAALRRYLVDEGLMARGSGEYWRAGGTVDLD